MAQSQQPQQQQPPPPASQSFSSPPVSSPSPANAPSSSPSFSAGITAPPAKRPRLSPAPHLSQQPPTPQQPFGSPSFGTLQLPKGGSPVNGVPTTSASASASALPNLPTQAPTVPLSQPPPLPQPGTMAPPGTMGPPPARQAEKTTDASQLTDVLASSGINVSEEEAYLTQGYGQGTGAATAATTAPPQPPRLQTSFSNASFTSQGSGGTISAGNSFTEQTPIQQQTPLQPQPYTAASAAAAAPAAATAPPLPNLPQAQPERTEEEAEEDARQRQDTAASRRAQYHLQDPFLNTSLIESQLTQRTDDIGVKLSTEGVFRPVPEQPTSTLDVVGPDGSSVVRAGRTIMNPEATLGDIISLVSLACEDRLRSVVEHSAALAQNRQLNSSGVVPDEWADLAATTTTPSGDKQVDGADDGTSPADGTSRKRSISAVDEPPESTPRKAVKLPNNLALQGRRVSDKDLTYEERREAKRLKRNSDAVVASGDASASASTPGAGTPGSERAPEPEKKVSKKEQKKAESKVPEAVQHQQAVETARMATGNPASRFGGKKRQYNWLKSGAPAASRPGMPSSATKPGAAGTAGSATPTPAKSGPSPQAGRSRLGEWREDGSRGAGIQIKDILFMLEGDGTGSRPVQKGYSRQTREELDRPAN